MECLGNHIPEEQICQDRDLEKQGDWRLFRFANSHTIVTRVSMSLSYAITPHSSCFSKSQRQFRKNVLFCTIKKTYSEFFFRDKTDRERDLLYGFFSLFWYIFLFIIQLEILFRFLKIFQNHNLRLTKNQVRKWYWTESVFLRNFPFNKTRKKLKVERKIVTKKNKTKMLNSVTETKMSSREKVF